VEKEIHKKHTAPPPPLPQKKYEVVYADPPWIYNSSSNLADASTITANGGKHYAGMTIEQMCDIGVKDIIADNAILFIWTTGPNMKNTFPIIDAWGFEFCTVAFVWDKQKINPGNYTISQCEFVLLGKHGKIPEPRGARDIRQFLSQERGKHSEKPQEIRHRIEQMFPKQKRLEMFARDKFVGWDVWGDEA
jgi:N6-adenosine-specific RNA methylase IME4